jgi:CheY-like chemotaxis protein
MDKLHLTRSTVPPALILLDMLMPVMDGQTFLNRARQDHVMKDVPIVVASGDPSLDAPGASAVLTKPIRPERLLALWLGRPQSSACSTGAQRIRPQTKRTVGPASPSSPRHTLATMNNNGIHRALREIREDVRALQKLLET